jgi:hypothetical protein
MAGDTAGDNGVQFPLDADGKRSTTNVAKRVWSAAVIAACRGDTTAADDIAAEKNWRHGYGAHVVRRTSSHLPYDHQCQSGRRGTSLTTLIVSRCLPAACECRRRPCVIRRWRMSSQELPRALEGSPCHTSHTNTASWGVPPVGATLMHQHKAPMVQCALLMVSERSTRTAGAVWTAAVSRTAGGGILRRWGGASFQQALAKLQTASSAAAIESARAGLKCLHNELSFVRAGVCCSLAQVSHPPFSCCPRHQLMLGRQCDASPSSSAVFVVACVRVALPSPTHGQIALSLSSSP